MTLVDCMFLKNYTSDVPVSRTIARIEELLAKCGATHVAKEYVNGGTVAALQFMIKVDNRSHVIKLPANPQQVFEAMKAELSRPRRGTMERLKEQSQRTAWRLMQDWVEVQISLINMKQADVLQVFLPYVWNGKKTYYEALKESGFKAMLPEKAGNDSP